MLEIFAPAKINLYLHITKKLSNGYHHLDSLTAFADIGDRLFIEEAESFDFKVTGPMRQGFSPKELDISPSSRNLVVRAVWKLARATDHRPDVRITLEKNLPFGAGIGGGSADAAAVVRGLLHYWQMPENLPFLNELLAELGADVPVCFYAKPARIKGIGEVFEPVRLANCGIVLVYPGKPCSTEAVFKTFEGKLCPLLSLPSLLSYSEIIEFLKKQDNHLQNSAQRIVPEIENVLGALSHGKEAGLVRMSGSGSCCFALYQDKKTAQQAANTISKDNPDWWVKAGMLAGSDRV